MLEQVVAGLCAIAAALAGAWVVEGGLRRRARRTLVEEFELLALLPAHSLTAAQLEESLRRRSHRYVAWYRVDGRRSSFVRRSAARAALTVICLLVVWLVMELQVAFIDAADGSWDLLLRVFGGGFVFGVLGTVLLWGLVMGLMRFAWGQRVLDFLLEARKDVA